MPTYRTPLVPSGHRATSPLAGGDRRAGCGRSLLGALSAAALCVCLASPLPAQQASASAGAVQQANAQLVQTMGSGSLATPQTRAVLMARHAALVQVFRDTPASARSYALPAATRDALLQAEPSFGALIEQERSVTGELTTSVADDFVHNSSRTLYSIHAATGDTSVSFVNPPAKLFAFAHQTVTVSGFGFPDVVAADTLRIASRAEAADFHTSQANGLTNSRLLRTESSQTPPPFTGVGITTPAPATATSSGPQHVAIILLSFPSTPATTTTAASSTPLVMQAPFNTQAYWNQLANTGTTPNLANYESETSYGTASFGSDVYGPFTMPSAYDCTQVDKIRLDANTLISSKGVNVNNYGRYIYVFPVNGCFYGGLASVPSISADSTMPHEYSWVMDPTDQSNTAGSAADTDYRFGVLAHESGHTLGLNHDNSLDYGGIALGPLDFTITNPGNISGGGSAPSDIVGGSSRTSAAQPSAAAPPPGSSKIFAINTEYGDPFFMMGGGHVPYTAEHRYGILGWIGADGGQDVTAAGNFSVAATEASTGLRTLHVLRDAASDSWVWVEFHQPSGVYPQYGISFLPQDQTVTSGATLTYETGSLDPGYTFILDTTPTASPTNFDDATLKVGSTWSDPYSLLSIKSVSQNGGNLGVAVNYDTACAAPVLNASTLLAAPGTGSVSVTAASGCSWTVSSNASWISFAGAASGTGNGSVNFAYTANTTAVQRTTYITTARQSQKLIQQGTGTSITGVTPAGTTVAPSTFVPFAINLTNPNGAASTGSFFFQITSKIPLLADQGCNIGAELNNGVYSTYDANGGGGDTPIGQAGTVTYGACTIDTGASTFTSNGNNATLTLSISFPSGFLGQHRLNAGTVGPTDTFGYVTVASALTDSTSLGANPASITAAQSTTLTASVNGSSGVPTGSVSFATASTNLGACTLASGTCSVSVSGSALQAGANSILATYAGGGGYPSSVSNAATVTVTTVAPTVTATPTFSPAAGTYAAAQTVTISDATAGAAIYYTIDGSTATTSSTPYSAPVTVGVSETLHAVAIASGASLSANAVATYTISSGGGSQTTINFGSGFTTNGLSLQGASVSGNILQLTDGGKNEAHSVFFNQPMNIKSFTTDFDFQLTSANADGFTFVLQNSAKGPSAVGGLGYNLGYGGMGSSVAVKFDLHNNSGEGSNSTGFYKNGASPQMPSQDLTSSGVNLHSGHKLLAHLTYDGTTLALTLTDTVTNAVFTTSTAIDIPGTIGSNTAYIGFTGGTGGSSAVQNILDWTFSNSKAPMVLDYGSGFTARGLKLQGATISGTSLQITDGGKNEARSAFYNTPVSVQSFSTDFNFQLTSATADGFTFTIQNSSKGPSAVGGLGYNLGYGGIGSSVAVKFDLHSNNGEGSNSTGFYKNGATPEVPSADMTSSGVNLHSGDKLLAHLTYDGATLTLTLTDTVTNKVFTTSTAIDIPGTVGSTSAYVGFTGGTGGSSATQNILNWTYSTP